MDDAIKETIKNAIEIDFLLSALGVEVTLKNRKELRGVCPVHGGDNKTAFRIRRDRKLWTCFTRNCHIHYGNDVIGLVQGVYKCGFREAINYLSGITGIRLNDEGNLESILKLKNNADIAKFVASRKVEYMPPEDVTEEALSTYKQNRTGYFEQWFPKEILDYFEIGGGYVDKCGITREIIPIRNEIGKLVAFSGRALTDSIIPKYLLTNGFDKNHVLYNLNNARHWLSLENDYTLIMVEGFKAVWFLNLLGYENVTACMGNIITEGQQNLILKSGVLNLILMLDGGSAGEKGVDNAKEAFRGKLKMSVIKLPKEKVSPDEYSPEFIIDNLRGSHG